MRRSRLLRNQTIIIIVSLSSLALLAWYARYNLSSGFGLYEDDYGRIPFALSISSGELGDFLLSNLYKFSLRGRPLHDILINVFTYVGGFGRDLSRLYLLGYFIFTLNAFLFFTLIRRISNNTLASLCTIAYILYSADITQPFLTLAFGAQPAITFFLVAAHFYLSERLALSYFFIFSSLITYETIFPVFLAVPLLKHNLIRNREYKKILGHCLILGLLITFQIIYRSYVGDDRLSGLTLSTLLKTPVYHMAVGPIVSIGTYVYRPIQLLQSLNLNLASMFFISFSGFFLFLQYQCNGSDNKLAPIGSAYKFILGRKIILLDPERMQRLSILLVGIFMLIMAYPLTFNIRPYAISGRDTRVHLAGVVGGAIIVGVVMEVFLLWFSSRQGFSLVRRILLSAYLSMLLIFGQRVQDDYITSWKLQKSIWTDVVNFVPDMEDGIAILLEGDGLIDTRFIDANTWQLPKVLNFIYDFPDEWDNPPRVYRLIPDWRDVILSEDGKFQMNHLAIITPPSNNYGEYSSDHAILLRTEGGEVYQRANNTYIQGSKFDLKPLNTVSSPIDRGPLYETMILTSD